ncbi:hypothetical protein I6I18_09030 [Kytococcus sedentarius]|uniref:Uncharacterized protein n=1 Tax=Kytococcus sedentarius (strain ATCC 14392 / DSM 20547 / JCM 11482 / CCUG 33030 / NBRC 15357 / NCTC 11040 / CCM 314 / 541) TaxID=478801 RepID=C7NLZ6_KYTSD|nr:hypothetical protein [Kytococcus sedentarius]ACV07245.1 hypothetical protein Ksed_22650 [Kytococcus sedentarius DSM 20547]QQB63211.1 hypothetical protein I6I18_09030 [Kytococcus sedentarius]STX13922.1 Uncharacterised protein [Kytococcus sedentarius]
MAKDKTVAPLEVELDEVGLSVLGWEIKNPRARLVTTRYSDSAFHEISTSMELNFHPDDWDVRHHGGSDYLPELVCQIRSRSSGPLSPYSWAASIFKSKALRSPKLVSKTSRLWDAVEPHDPDDIYVWIGAHDWTECPSEPSPSAAWRETECMLVDTRQLQGIGCRVGQIAAHLTNDTLAVTLRMTHPLGGIEDLMKAGHDHESWAVDLDAPAQEQEEFDAPGPNVIIQVFDETGFLLDSHERQMIGYITVGAGGNVPTRPPSSLTVSTFDLDDLPGTVDRVVVRLEDPT